MKRHIIETPTPMQMQTTNLLSLAKSQEQWNNIFRALGGRTLEEKKYQRQCDLEEKKYQMQCDIESLDYSVEMCLEDERREVSEWEEGGL